MRFATADVKPRGPAPLLGDNSEQVLRDFGMDNEAIAVLKAAGTIAQREQD
jgi:crotonobetainyl-CoA:carnitine CoA-transferase CaiB-like acyl-CoA transferase